MLDALHLKWGGAGTLAAIDPGRFTGFALFIDRSLAMATIIEDATTGDLSRVRFPGTVDVCILELPVIYDPARYRGDPNDLVRVAVIGGWVASRMNPLAFYGVKPADWKGQTPKDIDNRRTMACLSDNECRIVEAVNTTASKRHNVVDAVGIGLWALGRKQR